MPPSAVDDPKADPAPARDGAQEDEAPNVGVLMFVAYRAMETRVFARLAERGFGDVTPAQARIFQRIGP